MMICSVLTAFGLDHIILRNGQEFDVKLIQITDDKVVYSNSSDRNVLQLELPSKDIYMVYIEKQGNLYFTNDGKRITGEPERANPKKYDVIYLINCAEIAADNVRITSDEIRYSVEIKKSGFAGLLGKGNVSESVLNKSEVFMIRYKNGMRDIITPLDSPKPSVEKELIVDSVKADVKPEFVVVFHSVVRGETLEKISEKYGVTVQQLKEWNDLPAKTRPTTLLASGMQLMIYQPKQD